MGMATRDEISRRLMDGGRSTSTPVVVVEWGTTARQRTLRTTLGELGVESNWTRPRRSSSEPSRVSTLLGWSGHRSKVGPWW